MKQTFLSNLIAAKSAKHPTVVITDLVSGAQTLWVNGKTEGDVAITPALGEAIERTLRRDKGETLDGGGVCYFLQPFPPPKRMIIVGAVHIAQALVVMARLAGYDPILIDPRVSFASEARFPGETMVRDWPEDALETVGLDARTALVLLTHDPKLDDPAIKRALMSQAFYIGALGSKRTHAMRVERLVADGFKPAQIDRIHGPIGLDIAAASPSEIAVSIMAEMTRVLRQGQ